MSAVDDYLAGIQEPQREALQRVRDIIRQTAPEAEEVITYGMPGFKSNGKYLIAFANFKDHMSIFPGSSPTHMLENKLKGYRTSKGTIQFTVDDPLPESLLREIVQLCLYRNAQS